MKLNFTSDPNIPLMELPRSIRIRSGAVEETGPLCKRYHLKGSGIIVCDSITRKIAGERVGASLRTEGYDTRIVEIHGATDESVKNVMESTEINEDHFLLGVGGGRPIDVAKYVATHHDRDKYPYLYYTFWAMTGLLLGTFAFFGIHTLFWIPRSFRERFKKRREHSREAILKKDK